MRIGLNATCFNDRPSGARQRFAGIYGEVIRQMPDDEFVLYEPVDCRVADWFPGAANVSVRRTPVPSQGRARKAVSGARYWPAALAQERLDLFESFNLPFTRSRTASNILTIHDVRRLLPDWPFVERQVYQRVLRRALESADRVITVSHAMRESILEFQPSAPVSVVYNGLDVEAFEHVTTNDAEAARVALGLPSGFILAVGHLEKRKNYSALIEAVALLRDRTRDLHLVIVGNDSGLRPTIAAKIEALGLKSGVTILSALSDHDVRCLYASCGLFVFPSLYEGFGIPLLEAMAAGRPVVASDIPVFREISGDAARYVDPLDVEAIAGAIDSELSSRSPTREAAGRQRVKAFGFASLATQVADIYRSLR